MRHLIFIFMTLVVLNTQAEVIEFKIKAEDKSCQGLTQVVIAQDKTVLYQVEVPMSGTGQVHLLTGNYQIEAMNKEGCSFQDIIQISELPNKMIDVDLVKQPRKIANTMNPEFIGNNYPYNGSVIMGKPKIYLTGKDEGKFKLKFTSNEFNFLTTVPSFKDKEVNGELRKGSIYVENTWYPFLSFDARVSDEGFQNTQGFCGTKQEIFLFMMEGFKKYEFPDSARTDLSNSWAVKLPEASRYCVYPQVNLQLDKVVPVTFTFEDKTEARTERLFYLVIPQDSKGKRIPADAHRFADKPKKPWLHFARTVIPKTPYLYEWGVGFIFE